MHLHDSSGDLSSATGRFYKTEASDKQWCCASEKTMPLVANEWARTTGRLNINNDNSPGLLLLTLSFSLQPAALKRISFLFLYPILLFFIFFVRQRALPPTPVAVAECPKQTELNRRSEQQKNTCAGQMQIVQLQ